MIFYFSGTGNTRWIAEKLSGRLNEELIAIAEKNSTNHVYHLKANERIGFCFPVHGWQPPHIVRQFIRNLKIDLPQRHYCFAVCSCGDNIGDTIKILNNELNAKGLNTDSAFSVIMPESYVCLPFMDTDSKEKANEKIQNAEKQIERIASVIEKRETAIEETKKGTMPFVLSHIIGAFFNKYMITDKPFRVDTEKCISCGKCMKACPTNNIIMEPRNRNENTQDKKLPSWNRNGTCTTCLACYHHCPVHAINYGPITAKRGQYYFKKETGKEYDL
ncbi:EFR1 family ferrodoxin [Xylanibacter muris]|uniref:4Fe-4S dicluster domain-containing protein n=1 Tax=Xylanibacter muris TaxID=2736290 RepID=A0ABX2AMU8_9BACT|nr:EFR1 family ferrodoxin [Xylanibacter muris]NPD91256.1 4Fe-4S dicluster domain-containing protein [Xylanibacter muris]